MSVKTQNLIAREMRVNAPNYDPLPVVLTRGKGVWVWDVDNNRYLDMMSAYSAVSHGHCHPRLIAALHEQSEQLCLPSRAFYNDKLPLFLEKITRMTEYDKCLPMNSGAEAVETAIKAARRWGYRVKNIPSDKAEIIVADNNFHGRTTTIVSFSSSNDAKDGFGPLTPGFKSVPFGDADALEAAVTENTCAVLFEPIQGEGGIIVPPAGWLTAVADCCRRHHILFLLDEIQSGLGRTGKLFAYQYENVKPDGLILGKALGGGVLPVSVFLTNAEVMDMFTSGSHGSTFGGNPLAAAVALTALDVLEEEGLTERSAELGAYFTQALEAINSTVVTDIRGKGLWIGMELDSQRITGHQFAEKLLKKGVLSKETHHKTIRFAPPLVIKKDELDWSIAKIAETLSEVE